MDAKQGIFFGWCTQSTSTRSTCYFSREFDGCDVAAFSWSYGLTRVAILHPFILSHDLSLTLVICRLNFSDFRFRLLPQ
jgi:hypothetical protein